MAGQVGAGLAVVRAVVRAGAKAMIAAAMTAAIMKAAGHQAGRRLGLLVVGAAVDRKAAAAAMTWTMKFRSKSYAY